MNKRLALINLVFIAILVGGVLAYDVFIRNRPISNTGTIVAFNDIQVYSTLACDTVLTAFDWGSSIHRGDVLWRQCWAKNIGDQSLNVAYNLTGLASGISYTMKADGGNLDSDWDQALAVGAKRNFNLTLTFGSSAPIGALSFTLNIYAVQ